MIKIAIISIVLITASLSCKKHTKSEFRLNKYQYSAGEQLDFINLTKKKKKQVWHLVKGEDEILKEYEGKNPQIILSILTADGIYNLRVADNKYEMINNQYISNQILVKSVKGRIYFNNHDLNQTYDVTIDGEKIIENISSDKSFDIPVGIRWVHVTSNGVVKYSESINVDSGQMTIDIY